MDHRCSREAKKNIYMANFTLFFKERKQEASYRGEDFAKRLDIGTVDLLASSIHAYRMGALHTYAQITVTLKLSMISLLTEEYRSFGVNPSKGDLLLLQLSSFISTTLQSALQIPQLSPFHLRIMRTPRSMQGWSDPLLSELPGLGM